MFKRINILPLFFLIIFSNNLYADTKIGVVKLDVLFKEIPIYKESQNNLKKEFKA
jgi:Skp family chaperone for outer membrane proteins